MHGIVMSGNLITLLKNFYAHVPAKRLRIFINLQKTKVKLSKHNRQGPNNHEMKFFLVPNQQSRWLAERLTVTLE